MQSRTLSVLVENQAGVLCRVSGLFSRRGYNIQSLAVGETAHPQISRMTIRIAHDEPRALRQIVHQLLKLECVRKAVFLDEGTAILRELILVKVSCTPETRSEIIQIANVFRAQVVDLSREAIMLELTGDDAKTAAFLGLLNDFGILEVARTGALALSRGEGSIEEDAEGEA